MAKVTRIKARDSARGDDGEEPAITRKKVVVKDKKTDKTKRKELKKAEKELTKREKSDGSKKPFILFRPFVYMWRHLRDSWQELRKVRWPNRKATWKMVLAVFVYTALFMLVILLLDLFFTWLFNIILGKG